MAFWNRRHQMGWAALIMGGSIFVSRFMGLARDKIISYLFGATTESDIYFAAFVIPDFINYLLAGGYFSITLIPFLAEYFERDEDEGWRFFSTVFCWLSLIIVVLTVVAMLLAPYLAEIAAPGLPDEARERLAYFLRIILPAQTCFLTGSCLTALLYLRKQFFVPAITPLIYNSCIITGGILMRNSGMEGFCWGVLAGALIGFLFLPFIAARAEQGLRLTFSFAHPGLRKYLLLALPLMVGQSIVVLDEQLVRIFGSLAGTGAISWLNYARRIMLVPVGVVAQAAGVASYPFLAELAARRDLTKFSETLRTALQNVLTLLIPLSIWMMTASEPIIRLVFQQGRFATSDATVTARLLQILLAVVFCWGFQQVLGRAFYARQDTMTPAVLGTATTLLSLPVFFLLTKHWQAFGVACASALSIAIYTAALTFRWRARNGGAAFAGIWRGAIQVTSISFIAATPAVFIVRSAILDSAVYPYASAIWEILGSGLCFATLFLLLSCRLVPTLVSPLLNKTGAFGRFFLG